MPTALAPVMRQSIVKLTIAKIIPTIITNIQSNVLYEMDATTRGSSGVLSNTLSPHFQHLPVLIVRRSNGF